MQRTTSPSVQSIYNLGKRIINSLYHKTYNDQIIKYEQKHIVQLSEYTSNHNETSIQLQFPNTKSIFCQKSYA